MKMFILSLLSILTRCSSIELGGCNVPLGMESGAIPDEDIHASSTHDIENVGPSSARLNIESAGGAWCPSSQITQGVYEFLEIRFKQMHVFSSVEVQGRFGNGDGLEFAKYFRLEYWRPTFTEWRSYVNRTRNKIFEGNVNTYIAVQRKLDPPIIGSRIRIVPYSVHARTICMRVEVKGCPFHDGLVSYAVVQGDKRGEIDLEDKTYDGVVKANFLSKGIGQLIDGKLGSDSFRHDEGQGKGHEWIGWRNDTKPYVEITFEFDSVRNFSAAYIFMNNQYSKDIQVFSQAKIYFSYGGRIYNPEPVTIPYASDRMEHARNVTLRLKHQLGRFVKIHLYFASKWMLIGEVSFSSSVAVGNFSEEMDQILIEVQNDWTSKPNSNTVFNLADDDQTYIGIIIGVLTAFIFLLCALMFLIVLRVGRRKSSPTTTLKTPLPDENIGLKDISRPDLYNTLTIRASLYDPVANEDPDRNSIYTEPYKISMPRGHSPESCTSYEYAIPEPPANPPPTIHFQTGHSPFLLKKSVGDSPSNSKVYAEPEKYYPKSGYCKNLQKVGGNTTYVVPSLEFLREDIVVPEISRSQLKILEKLGEGDFGDVHMCELGVSQSDNDPPHVSLVAVKCLGLDPQDSAEVDFQREVKILARLRDANIVQVVGIITEESPLALVVEYLPFGDLNEYLKSHVSDTDLSNTKSLSYGALIFMATQIASGMKYLESLNFVHRDLATRNCLVGHNFSIKISDFAMWRSLYAGDYFKTNDGTLLPIKWMAWESVLLGRFTTKSDVWSFAVTLWEILTFAREQPFKELDDEEVLENLTRLYHEDGSQKLLLRPCNCPKEIGDLMRECWKRNPVERPNFIEIHLFLQRKNLGYSPC